MAFIVEDGTIVPNANAFISVEWADEYFLDRGVAAWAALSLAQKQFNIINATDYVTGRWGLRFSGMAVSLDQALPFPRIYKYGTPGVMPESLKRATAEYALRAQTAPLAPDVEGYDESGRLYTKKVEEVGPIHEEYSYSAATTSAPVMFRPYPAADMWLGSLLRGTVGMVIRA